MIYFIGNIEHNIVKIGYTQYKDQRIKTLQTACPYELILFKCIDGNEKEEHMLHERFKLYRKKGEWFALDQSIIDYYTTQPDYIDSIPSKDNYISPAINIPQSASEINELVKQQYEWESLIQQGITSSNITVIVAGNVEGLRKQLMIAKQPFTFVVLQQNEMEYLLQRLPELEIVNDTVTITHTVFTKQPNTNFDNEVNN